MHDDLDALRARGERGDGVVVGGARVDDERLAGLARELDLGEERALLVGARRAVAVVVEAGLPDRAAARVLRELGELGRRRVVEALGAVGVAAEGGVDLLEALGGGERGAAALGVHADREDAVHARLAGGGHQLVLGRRPVVEVGVGVDHWWLREERRQLADRAAAGAFAELGRSSSVRSSPSAASSFAVDSGM